MADKEYKAVTISRGRQGWGGPLTILPTAQRDKIVAVTGGGIPPLAYRIAELTGGIAVDGFRAPPAESEMACVVVDCGGTARCGVYPRKRIPTINLTPVGQSGPLADFIKEDIYVSGVTPDLVVMADGSTPVTAPGVAGAGAAAGAAKVAAVAPMDQQGSTFLTTWSIVRRPALKKMPTTRPIARPIVAIMSMSPLPLPCWSIGATAAT